MALGLTSILESDDDIEIGNRPLCEVPRDIRAAHCKTARELSLWQFSSSYQTLKGGLCDLLSETGLEVGEEGNFAEDY